MSSKKKTKRNILNDWSNSLRICARTVCAKVPNGIPSPLKPLSLLFIINFHHIQFVGAYSIFVLESRFWKHFIFIHREKGATDMFCCQLHFNTCLA